MDAAQLISDMDAEKTSDEIITAKALVSVFGIPGTPALVIGQTLVIGNISPRQLGALVEIEAENAAAWCSRV